MHTHKIILSLFNSFINAIFKFSTHGRIVLKTVVSLEIAQSSPDWKIGQLVEYLGILLIVANNIANM